ncbi:TPA: hypothetical protein DD690_00155 [Candidatus Daviesbacteria bacterium]|nr:hypothetical protein [Candidatus Daviesbacteria bacterium]
MGDPKSMERATLTTNQWSKAHNLLNLSQERWNIHGGDLFWTDSEEEALKIVDAIVPSEKPQSLVPSPDRRKLLKLAAAGITAAAVPLLLNKPASSTVSPPEKSKEYQEDPEVMTLRKRLEDKFNVKIMLTTDFYPKKTASPHWDKSNLAFLEKALDLLPSHFLQPDKNGVSLGIILGDVDNSGECACGATYNLYPHSVTLGIGKADPETGFTKSMLAVAHEFTHLKTLGFDETRRTVTVPEWILLDFKQIVGAEFPEARNELSKKLVDKLRPLLNEEARKQMGFYLTMNRSLAKDGLSEEELEKLDFLTRFHYGVSYLRQADIPAEFLAIMGEAYVLHGKDYFKKYYGEFFEPEIVERLYDFVKDDIFRGREY